ncbi:3-dehydroquinate synthase [Anaerotalea alkaliphila]|uniref:3-dehydroquinate synthase n=1 Tax=Anaerotalea alkaliphila TaxID=2662126 RepID=A0A7X5KNE0_9FIRM|nr:3-dehydroquinate synthase [Anaerotalea alkaliphila]NDL67934.1 3-dehydroquinate synthase [Anaerotalea alkaliphila]
MQRLDVETKSKHYEILVDQDFLDLVPAIRGLDKDFSSYHVVSDDNVTPLYQREILDALAGFGKPVHGVTFPHGEKNKNLSTMEAIYQALIENGADRKSLIVALGGGVAGDMAGYAAATYMRGIAYIQIPTTLLSQVDSSIGGKTGIDFNGYKNIIGAFHQPELVYINTATLKTLPRGEFTSGMAEIIKHAMIKDAAYFDFLELERERVQALDHEVLTSMILRSCEIKSQVVSEDETEKGNRALLNFGHTAGHAIERLMDFRMLHGECVSIGMVAAARLSAAEGGFPPAEAERLVRLLEAYGLPLAVPDLSAESVYEELFHDKKTMGNTLTFALCRRIGDSYLSKGTLTKAQILEALDQVMERER